MHVCFMPILIKKLRYLLMLWFVCTCTCAKFFPKTVPMEKLDIVSVSVQCNLKKTERQ